jgi:1,4-dihydroxy-2-naphthoate octaprenyltransferase
MLNIKAWLEAIRIRTLPLALSSTILGSFFAFSRGQFKWPVFILASLTTLFLQILSNLANDYGDFKNGVDNENRIGPRRLVQSGLISATQMRKALIILITLTFISGTLLIFSGTSGDGSFVKVTFFIVGVLAILAAVKYTVGKNPYGYRGLGDIFVFLFFGLIGVMGTYYLHTNTFSFWLILPATSIGLLSAGVLNLNNLRDYESDKKANKRTLVVMMGNKKAKIYHLSLVAGSLLAGIIYTIFNFNSGYQLLFIVTIPLFVENIRSVFFYHKPIELYPELKKLAVSTLLFSICFGLGQIL